MIEILKYVDSAGRAPFDRWLLRLPDGSARGAILIRLDRLALGLVGDSRYGGGVLELRVHFGLGYRVYFAWEGPQRVVLLGGGSKSTQPADIAAAKARLVRHREQSRH